MNVVLTGGSGFLGKHVQKACVASGVIPRALGRKDGDMRDPLVARRVLADAEVVVHLAADVGGVAYLAGRQAEAAAQQALATMAAKAERAVAAAEARWEQQRRGGEPSPILREGRRERRPDRRAPRRAR